MTNVEKEIYVNLIKNGLAMIDEKLKNIDEDLKELPYDSIYCLSTMTSKSLYLDKGILISTILDSISYGVGSDAALEVIDEVTKRGIIPMACPYEGEFIGYKKCRDKEGNNVIVTLRIPAHAKRSSAWGNKCRCSEAIVEDIRKIESYIDNSCKNDIFSYKPRIIQSTSKQIKSAHTKFAYGSCIKQPLTYLLGQTVVPDSFDPNRFNECSHGIHFFMTEQEALDYAI